MTALRRRSTGFTLIELIITIVISAMGAVLIFASFGTVLTGAHRPAQMLQAEYLARELAEEALAAGYGNVSTAITNQSVTGFSGFTRSRAAPVAVAAGTGGCPTTGALCEQVDVTVSINGSVNARQSVLLMGTP